MAKVTFTTLTGGFGSVDALNANFQSIADELNNNVFYRNNPVGEPNALSSTLDAATNQIINLPDPVSNTEPVTLQYLNAQDFTGPAGPTGATGATGPAGADGADGNVSLIQDDGVTTVTSPTTLNFTGAGVVVTDEGSNVAGIAIAGGGGSTPTYKGAKTYLTASKGLANNTAGTTISFDAVTEDTDGFWAGGSPTRLTVPSGVSKVRLYAHLRVGGITSGLGTLTFKKNGVSLTGQVDGTQQGLDVQAIDYGNSSTYGYEKVSSVISVTPGDYFELEMSHSSDTTTDIQSDTWFEIEALEWT